MGNIFKIKTVHRKNVTLALYKETANVLKSCFIQQKQILYQIADISFFVTHQNIHYTFRFYLIILFEFYSASFNRNEHKT